jgi:2Fe-2S ferredoxin
MSPSKLFIELINQQGRREKLEIRNDASLCLLELIEEAGLTSPYGCRVGSCGTCVVEVLKGEESLIPRSQMEEDTLSRVAPGLNNARLICRAQLKAGLDPKSTLSLRKIKIV